VNVRPIVMQETSVVLEAILTTLNAFQTRPHTAVQTAYQITEQGFAIRVPNAVIRVHIAIQTLDNVINLPSILVIVETL